MTRPRGRTVPARIRAPHPGEWPDRTPSGARVTPVIREQATTVACAVRDDRIPAPGPAFVRAVLGPAARADAVHVVVELVAGICAGHVVGQDVLPLDLTPTTPTTRTRTTRPRTTRTAIAATA